MFTTATRLGQLLHWKGYNVTWMPDPGGNDYIHAVYFGHELDKRPEYIVEAWFTGGEFSKATVVYALNSPTPIPYPDAHGLSFALSLFDMADAEVVA